MTTLKTTVITVPTAAVGPNNPLPPIQGDASLDKKADLAGADDEMRRNANYGRVVSVAPYLIQDRYTRERTDQQHTAITLENEKLRATFLPGLGGRLYALVDKTTGRDLVYRNPILQPANLGLRSAWFAGGVEWNIGTIGHTPLTCAPLHAAVVQGDDGEPFLRLYEFERLRRVVYQLDCHLPPGSDRLYVHVRITNPNPSDVPIYWWSNIAVPQSRNTRALAPADRVWSYSYDEVLRHEPVVGSSEKSGYDDPLDISYPARFTDAADFFFDTGDCSALWVASVDEHGQGLLQTSTRELRGRKLFRWGTSAGGRRWQGWLSGPLVDETGGYAEIQAGLARTQFEHLPMPAEAVWSWTESYGPITLSPEAAHGPWATARAAAEEYVIAKVAPAETERQHQRASAAAELPCAQLLHQGSGWGALEKRVRRLAGEAPIDTAATAFDDASLTDQQAPWIALLQTGEYPQLPPGEFPNSIHLHPTLVAALETAPGWAAAALAGVATAAAGDWPAAVTWWRESLQRAENPYARRHLAVAAQRTGGTDDMLAEYAQALAGSNHPALVIEALAAAVDTGHYGRALAAIAGLAEDVRDMGRVRVLEAHAALGAGDVARCGAILTDPALHVPDLREGEELLDVLWDCYTAAAGIDRALPAQLDFRMKPGH